MSDYLSHKQSNPEFSTKFLLEALTFCEKQSGYIELWPNLFSPSQHDICKEYTDELDRLVEIFHKMQQEFALPQELHTGDNDAPEK
ncbi:MAG: hypothetical protein LUD79_00380 [Oscillospiraceae bacterium]|nr:hypothetical protein [Oscillospiraceae bacterium]